MEITSQFTPLSLNELSKKYGATGQTALLACCFPAMPPGHHTLLLSLWRVVLCTFFSSVIAAFLTLLYCNLANGAAGPDCVSLREDTATYYLNNSISYYEDKSAILTLQNVQNVQPESWTLLHETVPSFGFSNSAYWLKFNLCKPKDKNERGVLEISYPLLDSLHLFVTENQRIVHDIYTGDKIIFSKRPEKHRNFIFFLPEFQENTTIYIRVQSESAIQLPITIYTPAGFFENNQKILSLQGIYFGIILAIILYNAFLFFSLREWPYLLYVFFTISYFSFQGVLQGFFQQFVFDSVWWQNHALLLFGYISILFANLFAVSFLNLPQNNPLLSRILRTIGLFAGLAGALASVLPYAPMVKLMLALAIPSALLIMAAGFKRWLSGHLPARIFTLAWSTLLISFVLASLNKFGILPRLFWTENIMQIGGVLEVLLLSIALGERINEEKRQRILVEQNLSSSLEKMVEERTLALNQALKQLETANVILDRMSLTDGLTQISNRRAFDRHLEVEFKNAARSGGLLALILIDIDHFKQFNDTYGHQVGDKVLQSVAQTLLSLATRPRDMVFRYGGEEFAVVLNNTNLAGAITVADKMRRGIEMSQLRVDSQSFCITISAGISVYNPTAGESIVHSREELIRQADAQLYNAKADGRNRVAPVAATT